MGKSELVERDGELAVISQGVAQARCAAGTCTVVEGEPGIGKSSVLASAASSAAGMLVLRARGHELESEFPFGVVRQLLEVPVRESAAKASVFSGAARMAAPLLGVTVEGHPPHPPGDPVAALHALYWVTANLAQEAPVMVVVDDAQWADEASLRYLAYLTGRLDGLALAMVVALRQGQGGRTAEILRAAAARQGTRVRLGALSPNGVARVLRELMPDADDNLCMACHTATGGNPFYLRELARSLEESAGARAEAALAQTPERVRSQVRTRLEHLAYPALEVARALSVVGDGAPLRLVAALARVGPLEAGQAADALAAAAILAPTPLLRFAHPIVRTAVYDEIGSGAVRAAHGVAARLLEAEQASAERVAAQVLVAEPTADPWACQRLLEAAGEALESGAAGSAVAYLRRALDEPPAPGQRPAVLARLGGAEAAAGHLTAAVEHLQAAVDGLVSPSERPVASRMLAAACLVTGQWDRCMAVLDKAAEAAASEPRLLAELDALAVSVLVMARVASPGVEARGEELRRAAAVGGLTDRALLAAAALQMVKAGNPAEATARVATDALAGYSPEELRVSEWVPMMALRALTLTERFEAARCKIDAGLAEARVRGATADIAFLLGFRSEVLLRLGELAEAEVDIRTSQARLLEMGWPLADTWGIAIRAAIAVQRGSLDEADALLGEPPWDLPAAAIPADSNATLVLWARGALRLAHGHLGASLEDSLECGRRQLAMGMPNPAICAWRSQAALALARLEQPDEATALAFEEVRLARAFGAPRALGAALRAAGVVLGGQAGIDLLQEAVDVLDVSPALVDRAGALVDLGAAIRRTGHRIEAREHLAPALDLAHRCGARALEAQALAELHATGARPRRTATRGVDALTPAERRVALLAVEGLSNRDMAQALFVTVRTVEFHLSSVYRKLGIVSRAQLDDSFASPSPATQLG